MDIQSIIGLTVQCAGIILIMVLTLFMIRSFRRKALNYWSIAWVSLSVALIALSVGFRVEACRSFMFSIYFLGEYMFGLMLIAGCRNHSSDQDFDRRSWYWISALVIVAVALPTVSSNFNRIFIPHAAIMGILFAKAFDALRPARRNMSSGPGYWVMTIALASLAIDFFHYVPVMTAVEVFHITNVSYLKFTSLYDLILEILLGFGSVMAVMDKVRSDVEITNSELIAARDRLENLARIDPLTGALNRHAFYSLVEDHREESRDKKSGWAVVIDIDNLKPINDSYGHSAGDKAIKAVASSIRSISSNDGMLFRWGGDEFLLLIFEGSELDVWGRTVRLDKILSETTLPELPASIKTIVSHGFAAFDDVPQIRGAIEQADTAMYMRKQARKAHCKSEPCADSNLPLQPCLPAIRLSELQAG